MTIAVGKETIERFKRQVEEEWASPQVAAGYRKWSRQEAAWAGAARDLIIDRARLAPGMTVLDVGSAHGEPGLAIAEAVGPRGQVTLTDIAPELLDLAAERARDMGLENVTTRVVDAHELPFPDGSFDRVTSRFAAMYFADYLQAFGEALRVLKPGGAAVYLVWGTDDQPMFRDILGILFQYLPLPEDEPGAPSPFTFSEPGALARALQGAGFAGVYEETATLPTSFAGAPEQWWEWMVEGAAPVQTWLAALADEDRQKAVAEIHGALRRFYDGKIVNVPMTVNVASGHKPS